MKNNVITNEVFNKAIKNLDYIKIMNSVCAKFNKMLDQDEIYQCKLEALWKSLKTFDPSRKVKFTSFLYEKTRYICLNEINKKNKAPKTEDIDLYNEDAFYVENNISNMIDLKNILTEEEFDIFEDKIFNKLTLKEIEKKYDGSVSYKKLVKVIEKCKKIIS